MPLALKSTLSCTVVIRRLVRTNSSSFEEATMKTMKMAFALACLVIGSAGAIAQTGTSGGTVLLAESDAAQSEHEPERRTVPLDAQRERQALRIFLKSVQGPIVSAAEAMPATKYEFIPT